MEDETAPRTEEIRRARQTAQRLRRLARRRTASAVRSITLEGEEQPVEVPAAAIEMLADAIEEMARGHAVWISPREEEITTQKAADLLNVSRPYLIGLLKRREIPFRMVGTHRRLSLADVLAYKERSDAEAEGAYCELIAQAQELGMS